MKAVQPIKEIRGTPGEILGNIVIPTRGQVIMRLNGDLLQTQQRLAWGLEQQENHTRLSQITSISIVEGRIWWLLWLGFATLVFYIGVIFIIAFFLVKQQWLVVYGGGETLILFFRQRDAEKVKLFRQTTLNFARHLSSSSFSSPHTQSSPASVKPEI
ncbi:MAG: hypothetical protein SVX43_15940 [Cyanobacteriota bacterium]|nr:hypothetical protein [Cyanobacteriota bacterium]